MRVTHAFTNPVADDTSVAGVRATYFNADHVLAIPEVSSAGNANIFGGYTVDFTANSTYEFTLTGAVTFIFTPPASRGWLALKLTQDATGGRVPTFPASVKWPGGAGPTFTATAGKTDFVTMYWNGTNYFASSSLNF